MKKKIAILGSTGSIGKTTLDIISQNKKFYKIILISTNKSYKKIFLQAKKFGIKNIIIHDEKTFIEKKSFFRKKNINIFNSVNDFKKNNRINLHYVMSAITGINGLKPTLDIIRITDEIAIANKESIICGWSLISSALKKNKTKFIPIDSEHFSISKLIEQEDNLNIKKIYITASGGPFLKMSNFRLNQLNPKNAIKHPNWKMGKKISVDSATLINKIFELIEAKKIFDIEYSKFKIIIQPTSYVHAIVDFNNGVSKILTHPTSMKIPIYNSLNSNFKKDYFSNKINLKLINDLNFQEINKNKFPIDKIIRLIPNNDSLFETVLVSANDTLVDLFLKKKIKFFDIYKYLIKILSLNEFKKFKSIKPKNLEQITVLSRNVRLKTISLSVRSPN